MPNKITRTDADSKLEILYEQKRYKKYSNGHPQSSD